MMRSAAFDENSGLRSSKVESKSCCWLFDKQTCYPSIYPDLDAGSPARRRQLQSARNASHLSPWHWVAIMKNNKPLLGKSANERNTPEALARLLPSQTPPPFCLSEGPSSAHSCTCHIGSHSGNSSIYLFFLFIFESFLSAVCTRLASRG